MFHSRLTNAIPLRAAAQQAIANVSDEDLYSIDKYDLYRIKDEIYKFRLKHRL